MALPDEPLGTPGSGGNGHKKPELKLHMPEHLAGGAYANSMVVHHSIDEFILDFAMVMGGRGQVVSRVVTSPYHMKRVLAALEENVRKYESQYGPIDLSRGVD